MSDGITIPPHAGATRPVPELRPVTLALPQMPRTLALTRPRPSRASFSFVILSWRNT